jgi:wyosine [tRNA(Phe)-imidazoG37] synthetase (radical SAM superfamily)
MKYTYGPVASWRYGRSLGVDITTPPKKCTFNCIYCQLGPTKKHVASPEEIQDDIPLSKDIIMEVRKTLERLDLKTVDVLTFSGTGEPTLNLNIDTVASSIRDIVADLPIILLTNASLLSRADIRKKLSGFDIITAKLDAGDEETFNHINRPSKGSFSFQTIREGIKRLGKEMTGILALEVMLLSGPKGLTNIVGAPRRALIENILEINPNLVQIYTPWRPAALQSIKPLSNKVLQEFGHELVDHFDKERVWIYGIHDARDKKVKWKAHHILEQEMIELLRRRPCRIPDISISLGIMPSIATCVLEKLQNTGIVKTTRVGHNIFYEAAS